MGCIATVVGGGTPDTGRPDYFGGGVAWLTPADLSGYTSKLISGGSRSLTRAGYEHSGAQLLPEGSVLFSSRAPIGYVAIAAAPVATNQGFKSFVLETGLKPDFIYYYLQHAKPFAMALASGTTFPEISGKKAALILVPVPPTSEQERIADALDEVLSDLDVGVANLERVRDRLTLYRASVLKAAVEGTLTEEWRAEHPNTEAASESLERILVERRRQWESARIAKFDAKGQEPPKSWKGKYREPATPDTAGLSSLPDGWCWSTLDQLTWHAGYGTSEKCRETNTGLPVLRIPNVVRGSLDLQKMKFAPSSYIARDEDLVRKGDLLVVRTNGSRTLIGRGAVIRHPFPEPMSFASYLIRLRLVPCTALLDWIGVLWESVLVRRWIESHAATSAGQFNINLQVLQSLAVPLPPPAEQEAIVDLIEDQLSVVDHLEFEIQAKLNSVYSLRKSILHRAFTGQLVPQDPNDEPASELLKRIAAERQTRCNGARQHSSTRRARRASPRRQR